MTYPVVPRFSVVGEQRTNKSPLPPFTKGGQGRFWGQAAKYFNVRTRTCYTGRTVIPGCRTFVALGMLLTCLISPVQGQEAVVKFGANESPPYWSRHLPYGGLCGEILHSMSKEVNLETIIEFKPIRRLIEDNRNNVTGNPMFFLANHDFRSTIPVALYYSALFYYRPNRKEDIAFSRLSDLKGYRIGVLKGTLVDRSYFDSAGIIFEESYSEQSLFKKLRLGRLQMCICIDLVGHLTIQDLFPKEAGDFNAISLPRSVTPIAIMMAQDYPHANDLAEKYRKGLRIIIENGAYQDILEKYYGKNKVPKNWLENLRRFADMYDVKSESR